MANFILRKVDDELWKQFRERAQSEGRSLRWLVLELIRRYIVKGLD
jgi:plasmid stability protein